MEQTVITCCYDSQKKPKKREMVQEVETSECLTALPIKAKGFSVNIKEFTDTIVPEMWLVTAWSVCLSDPCVWEHH